MAAGVLVKATPHKVFAANEFTEELPGLDNRRKRLVQALRGPKDSIEFSGLLDKLDLTGAWEAFDGAYGNIFNSSGEVFQDVLSKAHVSGDNPPEKKYVASFKGVVKALQGQSMGQECTRMPRMPYRLIDSQDSSPDKSKLKPDLAFLRGQKSMAFDKVFMFLETKRKVSGVDAKDKHLGQLADYALILWKRQPTRIFVPILSLIGCKLSLYVFTRSGFFWTEISLIIYMRQINN
ncbi:hypothetical protein GGH91_001260 [Coemansia sp. RSA 2671]|nr:hypothetical protein GGH91_001260 [Coemansia sp. RSA 2671]